VWRKSWNRRSEIPAILFAVAQERLTVSVTPKTRVAGSRRASFISSTNNRDVIAMERGRKVLVFIARMFMRLLFKSTSDQRSESISLRRIPVSRAQTMIGRSLDRFSSQASNSNSSSADDSTRIRLVSSDEETSVSLPENGCRSIQPSRRAIENILRRTVSSLFTVATALCRDGAILNFTFVSRR